ncbi:cell division control protein 45 [Moniliophthora roreri MCA 2997]|uniref:Cell division control protein 45 n=2 Tax=Moniliophthora roreri TaxID=221103 RepID=V2YME0_MONRO|nr:cell division control protein 45 [Moniliophthora roreri MCA 2997]KAI3607871.1 cell division control protein 45 [Moniliophthora roreri]
MVFLPLPSSDRPSYAEAYSNILTAHRRSPLTSASSVIILVAPDVDAICAARMLVSLLKQDDVIHRIIPVSGISELEKIRDELMGYTELHTLILINMGGILDLPSEEWFGDFPLKMTVHVIDSTRPQNLSSLFGGGENGERIIVWDDGGVEKLSEERKAWEALTFEPEPDSDEEDSDYGTQDEDLTDDEEDYEETGQQGKRRSLGDGDRVGKRRRGEDDRPRRMTRDERDNHLARLEKHYMAGTWHGQSASGTIYVLATVLERVDNDLLWLAILGLTFQYTTSRISRDFYERYHSMYYDEVFRLNPPPPEGEKALKSLNPDDESIRTTEELRFMLYRHWNLYDAMFHSSYVAGKLGIWRERGRKKLTSLLAKMGFSILQTQQPFSHMDMELKRTLVQKLNDNASEYGLVELSYPSFMRCYGFRTLPLSAADAVEGISALLDVAGGVRMEVEIEGTRNGGEWFGGGRLWEAPGNASRKRYEDRENVPPAGHSNEIGALAKMKKVGDEGDDGPVGQREEVPWWVRNFWNAYDALTDIGPLCQALQLSMSLHRAIIQRGTSIIDKQDIRTMRNHRVVVMQQGPDLPLFSHPGVLSRLAMWLVDALRDKLPGTNVSIHTKKTSLPFVVACLNEASSSYVIVGVMAALDFGDVRKNEFGLAFLDAKERCNARTRHSSFDTSVLEINQADLKMFLETLCEGPEAAY